MIPQEGRMSLDPVSDANPLIQRWLAFQGADIAAMSTGFVDSQSRAFLSAGHGVESGLRPTADTPYSIGSITKVFTAVGVLQLVAAGKVALNDRFTEYLPVVREVDSESYQFTIEDALMHRTGLLREGGFWLDSPTPPVDVSLTSIESSPRAGIRVSPISPEALYSNLGPQLLGKVIQAVTGRSRAVYMKEKVFGPLGMRDTVVTHGWVTQPKNRPPGYGEKDSNGNRELASVHDTLAAAFPGATDIWSTAADMANFVEFMLRGNENVLPDEWRQRMLRPQWQNPASSNWYSLGLQVPEDNLAYHGGHMEGFRSGLLLDRKAGTGAVILTNAMDAPVGWNQMPREILRALADARERDFGHAAEDFPERSALISGVYKNSRGGREEAFAIIGTGLLRHNLNTSTIIGSPSILRWYDDQTLEVIDDVPNGYKGEIMFVNEDSRGIVIEHSFDSVYEGPLNAHPRVTTVPIRDLSWVSKPAVDPLTENPHPEGAKRGASGGPRPDPKGGATRRGLPRRRVL